MQSTGQMSAIDDAASSQDDVSDGEELLTEDMALTVKTLEREVGIKTTASSSSCPLVHAKHLTTPVGLLQSLP